MTITEKDIYKIQEFEQYFKNNKDFLADYLYYLNSEQTNDLTTLFMDSMIGGFVENCGVSKVTRTIYWDLGWTHLSKNPSLWFDQIEPRLNWYFKKHYPDEFEQCKNYDIAILDKNDFIRIGLSMFINGEIPEAFKSLFSRNLYLYIKGFDDL